MANAVREIIHKHLAALRDDLVGRAMTCEPKIVISIDYLGEAFQRCCTQPEDASSVRMLDNLLASLLELPEESDPPKCKCQYCQRIVTGDGDTCATCQFELKLSNPPKRFSRRATSQ